MTISHAFALSSVEPARQAALIELLAEHDIALTTVAPGNREPLPLEALRAAGVRVGLGQDGIRDYWSPYGNGDVLERVGQLAFRAGYRYDELIERCVDMASRGGRSIVESTPWSTVAIIDDTGVGWRRGRGRARRGRRRQRDRRRDGPPAAHRGHPRRRRHRP